MKHAIKQYGGEQGLSPEQLTVAEILSTPGRGGLTLDDIAGQVGTSTRTINRWRNDPVMIAYIKRRSMENVVQHLPDVLETLSEKAKSGSSIKAIEVYLKASGLLNPDLVVRPAPIEDHRSEEALDRDIARLKQQLGLVKDEGENEIYE